MNKKNIEDNMNLLNNLFYYYEQYYLFYLLFLTKYQLYILHRISKIKFI